MKSLSAVLTIFAAAVLISCGSEKTATQPPPQPAELAPIEAPQAAESSPAETPQTINPEPSPQSEEMTAEDYYLQGVDRYVSEQDSQGAVESFTKAIELDPNHVLAYYNRGVAKLRLDDPEGAKADLTKAREIYASRGDEGGVYQTEDRLQQIKENHGI